MTHELQAMKDKIKENTEKIKVNKTLPYLVSNVIEVIVGSYLVTDLSIKMHLNMFRIYSILQNIFYITIITMNTRTHSKIHTVSRLCYLHLHTQHTLLTS